MRCVLILTLLVAAVSPAQDAPAFARALERTSPRALDHWMKRELHRHRKGTLITTSSTTYTIYSPTYDSLVTWLCKQPGVVDAGWDRCIKKITIWPGHSTIGVQVRFGGVVRERCYVLQEGRPGTLQLPGWRPRVRKSREELKLVDVKECVGFVEAQRQYCRDLKTP